MLARRRAHALGRGVARLEAAGGAHVLLPLELRLALLRLPQLALVGAPRRIALRGDEGALPRLLLAHRRRARRGVRRRLLGGGEVRGEAAAVVGELLVLEEDHVGAHRLDELALVRDEQRGPRRARGREELPAEPQRAAHVEVVGRLVEQQHVGAAEEALREAQPHPPAAREGGGGRGEGVRREAELGEHTPRARDALRRLRLERVDAVVQLGEVRGGGLRLVAVGERALPLLHFGAQCVEAVVGAQQRVEHRPFDADALLLQVGAPQVRREAGERAARDPLEERRLAHAVAADEGVASALLQRESAADQPEVPRARAGVLAEQLLPLVVEGHVVEVDVGIARGVELGDAAPSHPAAAPAVDVPLLRARPDALLAARLELRPLGRVVVQVVELVECSMARRAVVVRVEPRRRRGSSRRPLLLRRGSHSCGGRGGGLWRWRWLLMAALRFPASRPRSTPLLLVPNRHHTAETTGCGGRSSRGLSPP
mmetsp:Transcript_31060/g.77472  ORF Transcript_31060/g.77472 Transcript_31060/m.77472 type:complete len:485 (+) Transcript_31060:295-1749(+)